MDLTSFFIDRIGQFITGLSVNIIMLLISKKETGTWLSSYLLIPLIAWTVLAIVTLINPVPLIYWIALSLITIICLSIMFIQKKMEYNELFAYANPIYGWQTIDQIKYSKVLWRIRVPNHSAISSSSIDIEVPPRCPKCETQLEQSDNYLWYTWHCIDENCNFNKRTWNNMYKVKKWVNKVATRKLGL